MNICGIDPGLNGGIIILSEAGHVVARHVMPSIVVKKSGGRSGSEYNLPEIRAALCSCGKLGHVFVEKVHSMPKQGVASSFTFGVGFGILQGLLAGMQIPFTLVTPQSWQKAMFESMAKNDTKGTAALVCSRRWPTVDFKATAACRKAHDGLCDAALIAEYGRRTLCSATGAKL